MRTTNSRCSWILALALLTAAGCRDTLPCTDCDENADDPDDGPVTDLPCGGADLMTDNDNCGSCGAACALYYPDTEYEAGTCQQGTCGPGWSGCTIEGTNLYPNCTEICTAYGGTCVAGGCAGRTAMMFDVGFDGSCGPNVKAPAVEMTGSCDEPLPWLVTDETARQAMCCCDLQ